MGQLTCAIKAAAIYTNCSILRADCRKYWQVRPLRFFEKRVYTRKPSGSIDGIVGYAQTLW
ncbi:MAG: hypothetical protein NVS4B11_05030 [Ktedonobacteraceae bacterium]